MIEDFGGALSFDDIMYRYTIPQLTIMRLDKPSVDYDDESKDVVHVDNAEDFMGLLFDKKK